MATAALVEDSDAFRIYRNSKGQLFRFILEDCSELLIEDMDGKHIGEFEFEDRGNYGSGYKIMRMYTNQYKNTGLGSAALEYFLDIYGGPLFTSPNDGNRRDDGSHLTEDAPSFVSHMQEKGIIAGDNNQLYLEEDVD